MSEWQVVVVEPAKMIIAQIAKFVINILLVIVILIIGWVFARIIKNLVTRGLRILKADALSERIELAGILEKGGIKYSFSELIGVVCYWLILLVALVISVNAIGLTVAADLLNRIILYVPNIIAAVFILVLGMFIAVLLNNIVQTSANNAGISESRLLGKITEALVVIFAIAIALEQLNIGARMIELIVGIFLGSIGLGLAIAIGLGCKDIVGDMVSDLINRLKKK